MSRWVWFATVAGVFVQPGRVAAQESQASLTLPEAVRTALERNPQIRSANFGLDEANERVSEAWGSVYPSVDFNAMYTRNVSPSVSFLPATLVLGPDADPDELVPVRFGADNSWASTISLEQPLFNAAAFIGVGAAGRYRSLQEEVVRGEVQEVVTRVREAYYALLLAQEQARLTDNSVRRVRESLSETRALNAAGLSSEYDVLRLEVELANLEPNLRRAVNAVQQARRQLGVELDLPAAVAETLTLAGSLATMNLDDAGANSADNQELIAFVGVDVDVTGTEQPAVLPIDDRSDVRQLVLTESLRKTEMRLEQVEYLPRISFFGTYAINAQQNGDPKFFGSPRAYTRNVGLQVSVPIFQGFQRDARIDQKRAVLRQAETQTRYARSQAASEVRTRLDQAEESLLRARGQRLAVDQAQRGFEIARAQYREGLGSQLELTDAEVALRQSEFNYAQAVYDYLIARARLDVAVGRVPLVGTVNERNDM